MLVLLVDVLLEIDTFFQCSNGSVQESRNVFVGRPCKCAYFNLESWPP